MAFPKPGHPVELAEWAVTVRLAKVLVVWLADHPKGTVALVAVAADLGRALPTLDLVEEPLDLGQALPTLDLVEEQLDLGRALPILDLAGEQLVPSWGRLVVGWVVPAIRQAEMVGQVVHQMVLGMKAGPRHWGLQQPVVGLVAGRSRHLVVVVPRLVLVALRPNRQVGAHSMRGQRSGGVKVCVVRGHWHLYCQLCHQSHWVDGFLIQGELRLRYSNLNQEQRGYLLAFPLALHRCHAQVLGQFCCRYCYHFVIP